MLLGLVVSRLYCASLVARNAVELGPCRDCRDLPLSAFCLEDRNMSTLVGYFFGTPGPIELLVIAVIILLLFGNRLPSVMRSLGRGVVEFKKGVQGIEEEVDRAGQDAGNEKQASKEKQ